MKLGEVVVPMCTTTSPSFIKIGLEIKKSFNNSLFLFSLFTYFLIHFFLLIVPKMFKSIFIFRTLTPSIYAYPQSIPKNKGEISPAFC